MKKSLLIIGFALFAVTMFNSCGSNSTKEKSAPAKEEVAKVQYTCPMHPEIITDKPGSCPKCGMTLVEKK
jgi:hypothetical protein